MTSKKEKALTWRKTPTKMKKTPKTATTITKMKSTTITGRRARAKNPMVRLVTTITETIMGLTMGKRKKRERVMMSIMVRRRRNLRRKRRRTRR